VLHPSFLGGEQERGTGHQVIKPLKVETRKKENTRQNGRQLYANLLRRKRGEGSERTSVTLNYHGGTVDGRLNKKLDSKKEGKDIGDVKPNATESWKGGKTANEPMMTPCDQVRGGSKG